MLNLNSFNPGEYQLNPYKQNIKLSITDKEKSYKGLYWLTYTDSPLDPNTKQPLRNNIHQLLTLSPAGMKLFFIILYLLTEKRGTQNVVNLSLDEFRYVSMDLEPENEASQKNISSIMCKNTLYKGIKELVRIQFIKRVRPHHYVVNANYIANGLIKEPEAW